MTTAGDFPKPTWSTEGPRCPWCGSIDVAEATITLDQLDQAWRHDAFSAEEIDARGRPTADSLIADCPDCGRPFLISCRQETHFYGRRLKLQPIRTEADARLLRGET